MSAKQLLRYDRYLDRYVGVTSQGVYIEIDPMFYDQACLPLSAEETPFGKEEADWLNQWNAADPDSWSEDHPGYIHPFHHLGCLADLQGETP